MSASTSQIKQRQKNAKHVVTMKLNSSKSRTGPGSGGGDVVVVGTQMTGESSSATFAFFCSENEISIQPAALWTPQVPRFHRCKPFTKTHL